jgi:hypothetical protein
MSFHLDPNDRGGDVRRWMQITLIIRVVKESKRFIHSAKLVRLLALNDTHGQCYPLPATHFGHAWLSLRWLGLPLGGSNRATGASNAGARDQRGETRDLHHDEAAGDRDD